MEDNNTELKTYGPIRGFKLLNINVILDDADLIYSGMVEDIPENIGNLKYSKVDMINPITLYVYSELN